MTTMKRTTKAELETQLQSAHNTIEELENAVVKAAMMKLMEDSWSFIKSWDIQATLKAVAAVLVYLYVAGEMTGKVLKKYTVKISKHFVYESTVYGLAQPSLYPRSNRGA